MTTKPLWLIGYDISCPRRLRRMQRRCAEAGWPLQKSLYLLPLTSAERLALCDELKGADRAGAGSPALPALFSRRRKLSSGPSWSGTALSRRSPAGGLCILTLTNPSPLQDKKTRGLQ
ncbi:hypothetical protein [Aeromonas veronii]|uniref:hypothetical protein n=1 Tax=Aeromonas veronii TaxID=654 RepID=UPI003D1ED6D5